ncbi:MAG TPA: YafY family protein [Bacillota bacterium]|nr:YafY family protein [Bacillota bacterium]
MKLDRLLAIVVLLINRDRIQARELAEMFEVSVRTIYRDIETINLAGIPVVTYPGVNGGIGVTEGYRLDRNLLTNNELAAIVTALKSVSSTFSDQNTQNLLEKIQGIVPQVELEAFNTKTQQIYIDFTPWGFERLLKEKIERLKEAIETLHTVSFQYCSGEGEMSDREVEPHTLILKGQKWYLYAFCRNRNAFRLFKLARIKDLKENQNSFIRQEVNPESFSWSTEWNTSQQIRVVLKCKAQVKQLVEENFGVESLQSAADGGYLLETYFPDGDWLYSFILSFGSLVEVIEPEEVRVKIKELAGEIQALY